MSTKTAERKAKRKAVRAADRIQERLPGPARQLLRQARGNDIPLLGAALAFYAIVSLVPLTIAVIWLTSLIVGDDGMRRVAEAVGSAAPKGLAVERLVQRVTQLGTSLGVVSIVAGLWPATAYGSGLARAFDRVAPGRTPPAEGLRGRGLLLVVLLPIFTVISLAASFVALTAPGEGVVASVIGWVLALVVGFVVGAAVIALIYRVFPRERLPWRSIVRGTIVAAAGISLVSVAYIGFLSAGANFEEHYASSGVAGIVLAAVWLFLANILLLVGYTTAVDR